MPQNTDLVTDLPADFEVFGQAVATSMADLLGGASGYILSKNSATDMDFTWIPNDQGDITGITATTPLTGGGSSGAVTVGIQDALTTQKGAVQLSDSTSTTSSILAATPTAVKSAYDLADSAIAKSTVTTAGDIIYRNATVPARLGIGTSGQVLTVNSGATAPEWTTPSAGASFIGALAYSTTIQTLGNNSRVAMNLQAELYDTNLFHDNTTNNSRMTIPSGQGGKYFIGAMVSYESNTTGYRQTAIRKNGVDIMEFYGFNAGAAGGGPFGSIILDFVPTDYIEVWGRQGSGGNLNTEVSTYTSGPSGVYLFIQKVG